MLPWCDVEVIAMLFFVAVARGGHLGKDERSFGLGTLYRDPQTTISTVCACGFNSASVARLCVVSMLSGRANGLAVDAHSRTPPPPPPMHIYARPGRGYCRVLLNKADTIDTQQLMRVYGALMWSLGKVMQTPEVCRVYIGSFWEAPLSNSENRLLLDVSGIQDERQSAIYWFDVVCGLAGVAAPRK